MSAFLLDIGLIGIVAYCTWRGFKNGLIRGVFGVVALVAAIMLANITAQAYSKEARAIVMPFAAGVVDSTLSDLDENDIRYHPVAYDHDISDPVFGEAYMVLRRIGFSEAASVNLAKLVAEDAQEDDEKADFIDSIAEKITDTVSYVAVFGVAFLVFAIIFAVIGNLIGFVFSLPGLKLVDTISGTALGLVRGLIVILTLAAIFRYFGLVLPIFERTTLFNYLINNNLIANALKI